MKEFFYSLYALFFNISVRFFPLKEKRVCFLSMHNEGFCDSLGSVCEKLRQERSDIEAVFITREDLSLKNPFKLMAFFLVKSRLLATSKYVFLNDNFMPMGKLCFRKDAVITILFDKAVDVFQSLNLAGQLRIEQIEVFTSLTADDINAFKYIASAIGVNNERAFLTLKCSQKITIVSFKKGSRSETVTELDVDEAVYKIIGNFVNLFLDKFCNSTKNIVRQKIKHVCKMKDKI